MKRTIVLLATAVLVLGGCAGKGATEQAVGQTTTAAPTPSATPTPTPTPPQSARPAPVPLTIAQAGRVYLAAVSARNKTADKWSTDVNAGASVKTLRADATRARAAERHFLEVLDSTLWPAAVAKNAANLSTCTAAMASWFDLLTRIGGTNEIPAAPDCGGADSQLIRVRLHLSSKTN